MAANNKIDHKEISEAIRHGEKAHGGSLAEALTTSAFSRLPLQDQVKVVKHYANTMPEKTDKDFGGPTFQGVTSKTLKGLGKGALMGFGGAAMYEVMHSKTHGLSPTQQNYNMAHFVEGALPMATGASGIINGVYSGVGEYNTKRKQRNDSESFYKKLKNIKDSDSEEDQNRYALSLLSSLHKINNDNRSAPANPFNVDSPLVSKIVETTSKGKAVPTEEEAQAFFNTPRQN